MASRIFLQYAQDVHGGFLDPSTIIPDIFQDQPHRDPYALMTEFLDSNPHQFMAPCRRRPRLHAADAHQASSSRRLAADGGYGPTVQAGSLRPGDTGQAVVQLRNRLMRMGYLDRSATAEYDSALAGGRGELPDQHGITADGIAGDDDPCREPLDRGSLERDRVVDGTAPLAQ
jgi:L,D-transpeptidase YcbB